jgi:hypothetical protein
MKKLVLTMLLAAAMVLSFGIVTAYAAGMTYDSTKDQAGPVFIQYDDSAVPTGVSIADAAAAAPAAPYSVTAYINDTDSTRAVGGITWLEQSDDGALPDAGVFPFGTGTAVPGDDIASGDVVTVWINDALIGWDTVAAPAPVEQSSIDHDLTAVTGDATSAMVHVVGNIANDGDSIIVQYNDATVDTFKTVGAVTENVPVNGPFPIGTPITFTVAAIDGITGDVVDSVDVSFTIAPSYGWSFDKQSINFGNVPWGSTPTAQFFVITNTGNAELDDVVISDFGGFNVSFVPDGFDFVNGGNIPVGDSLEVLVTPVTSAVGPLSATLQVSSDAFMTVTKVTLAANITAVIASAPTVTAKGNGTSGAIDITIAPPATQGSSAIDHYVVMVDDAPVTVALTGTGVLAGTITGMTDGVAVNITAVGVDDQGVNATDVSAPVTAHSFMDITVHLMNIDNNGATKDVPWNNVDLFTTTNPTAAGQKFDGWVDSQGAPVTLPQKFAADTTLTATWVPSSSTSYMIKIGSNVLALKAGTAGSFTLTDTTAAGTEVTDFGNVISVTSLNTAILVINPPATDGGSYTFIAKGTGSVVVQVKIYNAAGVAVITDSQVIKVS